MTFLLKAFVSRVNRRIDIPMVRLRVTPSMDAGVSDHVWSIEEIVSLRD